MGKWLNMPDIFIIERIKKNANKLTVWVIDFKILPG